MPRKNDFKKEKLEEKILFEANMYLRANVNDPRLNAVSFTRSSLNMDFSIATLYWDTYQDERRGDVKAALDGLTGRMRTHFAALLSMKEAPVIKFHYDSQVESERDMEELINSTRAGVHSDEE